MLKSCSSDSTRTTNSALPGHENDYIGKTNGREEQFTVPFAVSESLLKRVRTAFGADIKLVGRGFDVNEHALLHVERMLAEAYILNKFVVSKLVLDVGGSVNRHAALARKHVWSCCPRLSSQDVVRNNKYKLSSRLTNWCEHRVQECDCVQGAGLMMIHSAYYFSPREMLDLSRKYREFFIAIHEFNGYSGRFHNGEAHWKKRNGKIAMSVAGASFGYEHGDVDWVKRGSYWTFFNGQVIFNKLRTFGYTSVYSVVYSPRVYRIDPPSFDEDMLVSVAFNNKDGSQMTLLPCGVAIPTVLLNDLFALSVTEDKETSRSLYAYASKWAKQHNSSITVGSYISDISTAVEWVVANKTRLISEARRRVAYAPSLWTRLTDLVYDGVLRVCNVGPQLLPLTDVSSNYVIDDAAGESIGRSNKILAEQHVGTTPCRTYNVLRPSITLLDKQRNVHLLFPSAIAGRPITHNNDPETIIDSLNRRALAEPSAVDENEFRAFANSVGVWLPLLFPNPRPTFHPSSFEMWNARFPPSKREKHVKAWFSGKKVTPEVCMMRQAFVKSEVTYDTQGKPARMITGVDDLFKVNVGPYLHKLSTVVGGYLKGSILYAPGKTTDVVGSWYDINAQAVTTDMSRFDSCVTGRYMKLMLEVYRYFNFPSEVVQMLDWSIGQRLYFSNGLIVEPEEPRRSSGHPNTTIENTLLNMFLHLYAITKEYGFERTRAQLRMVAGGDDVALQMPGIDTNFVKHLIALGFVPKPQLRSVGMCDFYSSWFIPTTDGVVLTPKIGRFLRKLGSSVIENDKRWFAGVLVGNMAVFNHVPCLIEFLQVMFDKLGINDQVEVVRPYNQPSAPKQWCLETYHALECIYPNFVGNMTLLVDKLRATPLDGVYDVFIVQEFCDCE